MVIQYLSFFQQAPSHGQIQKSFTLINITATVLEVGLGSAKELRGLHNNYPLDPDKIGIKREMFSDYQLHIVDLYNIPIDNV